MISDIMTILGAEVIRTIIGLICVIVFVVINTVILTWAERKVAGHMQRRIAVKEVGPFGLLQALADSLKLLAKELITPAKVQKTIYLLAPTVVFIPALVAFVVIPFDTHLMVKDINMGILVIFAFASLSIFAILMAGWGSNNKYSLIGAVRSVAQNIAYEIPLLLSVMSVVIMTNSFSLRDIVEAQKGMWNVVCQPVAFLLFFIAGVAETNRTPFDLPEAESELVAGFHTEYSGMRFALFFLAEYTNVFIVSAICTSLFLGGYNGPVLPGILWFLIKSYFLVFVMLWFRWTFPRVRFDQLLNFSWKTMIPIAFLNLLVTALVLKIPGGTP